MLIARTAFSHEQSDIIHSPITLKGQECDVALSAKLKVYSNYISMQSACLHENHSDGSECSDLIPPSSPTLYYHPVVSPSSQKVIGVISGLPSSLDFSTSTSNLCEVDAWSDGTGATISINSRNFVPGSIVIYRTSLTGSKLESIASQINNIASSPHPLPYERISNGYVQLLWQVLGVSNRTGAMAIWNKLGQDLSLGFNPCFNDYNDSLWPEKLKECVNDLEMEDINVLLFRSSKEEFDTIGILYL